MNLKCFIRQQLNFKLVTKCSMDLFKSHSFELYCYSNEYIHISGFGTNINASLKPVPSWNAHILCMYTSFPFNFVMSCIPYQTFIGAWTDKSWTSFAKALFLPGRSAHGCREMLVGECVPRILVARTLNTNTHTHTLTNLIIQLSRHSQLCNTVASCRWCPENCAVLH